MVMAETGPKSRPLYRAIRPYSRLFDRGVLAGSAIDGRSVQGKYARNLEIALIQHVGGAPSIAQKLLIDQAIKIRLQLNALGEKLDSGEWTDHDRRTFGGLMNCFRLTLRDIGLKSPATRSEGLDDFLDGMTAQIDGESRPAASKPGPSLPKPRPKKPTQPPPLRLQRPSR
jgi:hypothetical protein